MFKILKDSYGGKTHDMICDFLEDKKNFLRMKMIVEVGSVLQTEYTKALDMHKDGQYSMMLYQAERNGDSVSRDWDVYEIVVSRAMY